MKLQPRIVNGDRAQLGDFPWHASLVIKYRQDSATASPTFCSGAILNEYWILSTADCIANATSIRVDVGSVDINNPFLSVLPDAFIIHPQYNQDKFKNNIVLLRLPESSKLIFSTEVSQGRYLPVRLPKRRQINESFDNYEAYYSSFGYSSQSMLSKQLFGDWHDSEQLFIAGSKNMSEFLLFSEQQIISNTACAGYYGNDLEMISPQVMCALGMNLRQAACLGDAGAPLVINEFGTNTLIGLLSFVHEDRNCGQSVVPAVFTRITSHIDWIVQLTGYQIRP